MKSCIFFNFILQLLAEDTILLDESPVELHGSLSVNTVNRLYTINTAILPGQHVIKDSRDFSHFLMFNKEKFVITFVLKHQYLDRNAGRK